MSDQGNDHVARGFDPADRYDHPPIPLLLELCLLSPSSALQVYHPNIDLEGNVCLNILREDWKPVLSINSLIMGLQFLMADPNPDDPLNKDAAEMMRANRTQFENMVAVHVRRGAYINQQYFPAAN